MELSRRAIVYWRVRPTLGETWRQYARYAEGDAAAHMYPQRHRVRFAAYAFAATALVSRNRWLGALTLLGGAAYAARPIRRAFRRLPAGSPRRAAAVVGVPAMMVLIDAAKMWGYLCGAASGKAK
jgi:cellulose synthase/poly-beta-1,6-N-acetylglucosamine synthase-like glycosyltransferase